MNLPSMLRELTSKGIHNEQRSRDPPERTSTAQRSAHEESDHQSIPFGRPKLIRHHSALRLVDASDSGSTGFFVLFTARLRCLGNLHTHDLNVPPSFNLLLGGLLGSGSFSISTARFVGALDKRMAMVRPVLSLFIGVLVAVQSNSGSFKTA